MTLHTIIEQCLPKEANHKEWFSNLDLETKSAFQRRASSDADADLIYWGYNLCREHTNDSIPTIVELLIAEMNKFDEYAFLRGLGLEDGDTMTAEEIGDVCEQMKQQFINLLKQK